MHKTRNAFTLINILVLLAILSACNMPGASGAVTPTINATQAYQTVEARLTEAVILTPSQTPQPSPTAGSPATTTNTPTVAAASPTSRPFPTATAPAKLCDQAAAGSPIDVTIPDDTKMQPGQTFTKTWRLLNAGTCTWTREYSIAVFSGDAMSAPTSVPMPSRVEPGQTVDISVDLIAPAQAGTYQGNWKLRNATTVWFGIGPNAGSPFWVRILVAGSITGTPTVTSTSSSPGATATPTSPVQVSGTTSLIPNDKINLDTGQINVGGGEDMAYDISGGDILALAPLGSSRLGVFGQSTPSMADCQNANLAQAPLPLETLNQGLYLCYRTDQGLFGWMRLLALNNTNFTLTIQINTWALP